MEFLLIDLQGKSSYIYIFEMALDSRLSTFKLVFEILRGMLGFCRLSTLPGGDFALLLLFGIAVILGIWH